MRKKLVSMIDFILDIDWLTTTEFCNKFNVPLPKIENGVEDLLQIDAIKQRMFVEYAKFLNKELTIDMFIGDYKIFDNGAYIDRQPSHEWNTFEIFGKVIFRDSNTKKNVSLGFRVKDLVELNLFYNEKHNGTI